MQEGTSLLYGSVSSNGLLLHIFSRPRGSCQGSSGWSPSFFLMGTLIIADVVKSVLPCALHVLPFQPWLSICNFAFNSAEVHWPLVKKITRESKVQSKMIRDYCKILCPGFQAAVMQLTTNTYHFLTQESEGIQRPKTSIFANRDLLPAHIQS